MAKNIDFMGATFPDVPSIRLPQHEGGLVSFDDTSDGNIQPADVTQGKIGYAQGQRVVGTAVPSTPKIQSLSVTENGTYTAPSGVDGYSPVTVNVSGGGGTDRLVLLKTESLGHLSTTSTSSTSTGIEVQVSNFRNYDLLIVEICRDEIQAGYHLATYRPVYIPGSNSVSNKDGAYTGGGGLNFKVKSTGVASNGSSSTSYGIYPNTATMSNDGVKMTISYRYNTNHTSTIDGDYTCRVYGVNLYNIIAPTT